MDEAPPAGSLVVEVAFDRKEQRAAAWAAANRLPWFRRPLVVMPLAVGLGLLLIPVQEVLSRVLNGSGPSLWGSLLLCLLGLGALVYAVKFQERRSEELERHELNPDVYTLNDHGLEISGAQDLVLMSWPSMTRVHETDRLILFVAGPEVQYLPKRALSAGQLDLVRGLIRRHVPGRASQRSLTSR